MGVSGSSCRIAGPLGEADLPQFPFCLLEFTDRHSELLDDLLVRFILQGRSLIRRKTNVRFVVCENKNARYNPDLLGTRRGRYSLDVL